MSEFDKEAEREKLRKKYEQDKKEREATKRMSDLLLKGARMTNTHCQTCGDPLFEQDEVTFCPSCHGSPDAVEGMPLEDDDDADTDSLETTTQPPEAEPATQTDQSTSQSEQSAPKPQSEQSEPVHQSGPQDPTSTPSPSQSEFTRSETQPQEQPTSDHAGQSRTAPPTAESQPIEQRSSSAARDSTGTDTDPSRTGVRSTGDSEVQAARASLRQALEEFSRRAAETDDPRYAKECLEAAHEAARTLRTV